MQHGPEMRIHARAPEEKHRANAAAFRRESEAV